jgi:hypothetical protein
MENMLNKYFLIQKPSVQFQREIKVLRGGLNTLYPIMHNPLGADITTVLRLRIMADSKGGLSLPFLRSDSVCLLLSTFPASLEKLAD